MSKLTKGLFRLKRLGGGSGPHWEEGPKTYPITDPTIERFRHAADIVDRRDGYAMRLARYWQTTAVALALSAVAMAAGWYQQAQRSQVQVIEVSVDRMGDPQEVIIPGEYTPGMAEREAAVKRFVEVAFAKSSDPNVNRSHLEAVRSMIGGVAIARWNQWSRESDASAQQRLVRVVTIKHTASDNLLTVIWQEQDWMNGHGAAWRRMNGDFTLEYRKPRNRADVMQNPLGLYVVRMDFGPEAETTVEKMPIGDTPLPSGFGGGK